MQMTALDQHGVPPRIYLKPGEICFSKTPVVVTTVLGSCVSVTLFHPASGRAAICHALQPRCPQPYVCAGDCTAKYRYAACAIEAITRRMTAGGTHRSDIEVKLFGGAALIGNRRPETLATSLGRQNVEAAMEALHTAGLRLKVANVGGTVGRKIIFHTATGEVFMKRLKGIADLNANN